jgi:hypothetical protein
VVFIACDPREDKDVVVALAIAIGIFTIPVPPDMCGEIELQETVEVAINGDCAGPTKQMSYGELSSRNRKRQKDPCGEFIPQEIAGFVKDYKDQFADGFPSIEFLHRSAKHERLIITALLEKISVGEFILRTDHDRTLFDAIREERKLKAINKLTARHKNMKIGLNIRPREGWVAEHVEINTPDLNSVTCGDHISGQRGDTRTQARIRSDLSHSLCNGRRHKGFVIPEFLSDAILRDRTNTLCYLNMDAGGYVLIDNLKK